MAIADTTSSPKAEAEKFRTLAIPLSRPGLRPIGVTRTVVVPVGRHHSRTSVADFEVPKIVRNGRHVFHTPEEVAVAIPDSPNADFPSSHLKADARPAKNSANRTQRPRSPIQRPEPLPITEREVVTVDEAATVVPASANALRHKIWLVSAYASLSYEGMPDIAEFAKCVRRPPGQRRVYLVLPLLLAYFAGKEARNVD